MGRFSIGWSLTQDEEFMYLCILLLNDGLMELEIEHFETSSDTIFLSFILKK